MEKLFAIDSGVYRVMTFIYRVLILNFLWCTFSLPLVTIGASTTALLACTGKMVRGEELREIGDFWSAFKRNFKQATLIWIVLAAIFGAVCFNLNYAMELGGIGTVFFVIQIPVAIQLAIVSIFIFPLLSRYEARTVHLFRSAVILGNSNMLRSVLCIMIAAAVLYAGSRFLPLLTFGAAALLAYCLYGMVHPVLAKYEAGVGK